MSPPRPWSQAGQAWQRVRVSLAAWLAATVWGSVVQTQFNLQDLAALGVDIPAQLRGLTTLQDLAGFAPMYAGIVAAAWLPFLSLAVWLARRWPTGRVALFASAGGLGLVLVLRSIDALAPMPVFIDATRHLPGLLTMVAGSMAAAAWLGHRTRTQRNQAGLR